MERKHSFFLHCIIRKNRKNQKDTYPVFLRITVDSKRAEIATKIPIAIAKWNVVKGRLNGISEETKRINKALQDFELKAIEVYNKLLLSETYFTAESIKNEITGTELRFKPLIGTFEEVVTEMESRVGNGYSPGTVENWKVTFRHLKEYVKEQYYTVDITFRQLNYKFIANFDWYARTQWKCGTNAILKHIERIRKVIKLAINCGWLEKDPFANFKCLQEKTHRTFLTKEGLASIESKDFSLPRLDRVRDIFIFSCYTGLAYVDIEKLTENNLVIGMDGKKWIYTFRQKTNTKSNIPLLPKALQILEKHRENQTFTAKLLPVITNIKTNAYLKEIADLCGIKKNLTFHMGRHTFATTITLSNGVPMETVSKMLGHTKITTTQIYAKVLENKVSDDMMALESKLYQLIK
jgi:site-specific recombinase XerD